MSIKSETFGQEQMLRSQLAQVEDALEATEALDIRKHAQALSANDAARAWSGFARRLGYRAALARHDAALRDDIARTQQPEIAHTMSAVRQMVSPLPADTCRIWGVISGGDTEGLTIAAVKPGGAILVKASVSAMGQYVLDTRCKDKSVTLEIRGQAERLLLQDRVPLVLVEGAMIERSYRFDRCNDLVPDRPSEDANQPHMPDLIGETAMSAEAQLAKIGRFTLRFEDAYDPADKGRVIAQMPAAGDPLKPNTVIVLTLSRGALPDTKMPDLVGKTPDDARKVLSDLQFAALAFDYVDDPQNIGRIAYQDPAANAPLGADTRITLCVGQESRVMPDVIGQPEAAARKRLVPAFAANVTVTYHPDTKAPGIVIRQVPEAGKPVGADTKVHLVVSQKQDDRPSMPDLRGMTRAKAEAKLAQQGQFMITIRTETEASPKGVVFAHDPAADMALPEGGQITLYVSAGPQVDLRLPNLVGLTDSQASAALAPMLSDNIKVRAVQSDKPAGTVVDQWPKAGTSIAQGDPITLDVAKTDKDSADRTMPSLHGLTAAQAKKALKAVGITSVVFDETEARRRGWQVVRQQPAAGRIAKPSQEVRLKFGPKS